MARSRNIKPGFFKNEVLATLDPIARIAFAGLWCVADRSGRLEDRPLRIKIEVLPYDDCDINAIICDLEECGFIHRYAVDNIKYIQILNFDKHQSPHKNEAQSTIPSPECSCAAQVGAQDKHQQARPDSLNTDSLNPSDTAQAQSMAQREESFDDFWTAYPKKKDKDKSRKAWMRKKLYNHADTIIADVINRQKTDWSWLKDDGKFIPYPTTYLNNKRWEDEITPIPRGRDETRDDAYQRDNRSRAQRVSDKLDEIARRDVEQNGFTQNLG